MANTSPILGKDFDVTKLHFQDPTPNAHNGKQVFINYDNGPLYLQTPRMHCPFGLSRFGESEADWKYSLDLSFRGLDRNPSIQGFYEAFQKFDAQLINESVTQSQAWFKKKSQSVEVSKALYTPQIRVARDKETGEPNDEFPPTFKIKLPWRDGNFQFKAYKTNREEIPQEEFEKQL